jgi:hypothetical protein
MGIASWRDGEPKRVAANIWEQNARCGIGGSVPIAAAIVVTSRGALVRRLRRVAFERRLSSLFQYCTFKYKKRKTRQNLQRYFERTGQ